MLFLPAKQKNTMAEGSTGNNKTVVLLRRGEKNSNSTNHTVYAVNFIDNNGSELGIVADVIKTGKASSPPVLTEERMKMPDCPGIVFSEKQMTAYGESQIVAFSKEHSEDVKLVVKLFYKIGPTLSPESRNVVESDPLFEDADLRKDGNLLAKILYDTQIALVLFSPRNRLLFKASRRLLRS